jgi:hypothetical protein
MDNLNQFGTSVLGTLEHYNSQVSQLPQSDTRRSSYPYFHPSTDMVLIHFDLMVEKGPEGILDRLRKV